MRGRLTFPQMLVGTILGVMAGVYIYKPVFEQHHQREKLEAQGKEEKRV